MLIASHQKEYKDYMIFMDVYHSLINVNVWNWKNDIDVYQSKFIDYSVDEIFDVISYKIDDGDI